MLSGLGFKELKFGGSLSVNLLDMGKLLLRVLIMVNTAL